MIEKTIDKKTGRVRVRTINDEPDKAQQQYKDSTDVNNIMKKYEQTGQITHINAAQGRYVELGEPTDLMDAKMRVIRAEQAFMTLPAELRAKCGHEPANFLKMLADGSNDAELIKLGIKLPKPSDATNVAPKPSDSAVVK